MQVIANLTANMEKGHSVNNSFPKCNACKTDVILENISCDICSMYYHTQCVKGMTKEKFYFLMQVGTSDIIRDVMWLCKSCLSFFTNAKPKIFELLCRHKESHNSNELEYYTDSFSRLFNSCSLDSNDLCSENTVNDVNDTTNLGDATVKITENGQIDDTSKNTASLFETCIDGESGENANEQNSQSKISTNAARHNPSISHQKNSKTENVAKITLKLSEIRNKINNATNDLRQPMRKSGKKVYKKKQTAKRLPLTRKSVKTKLKKSKENYSKTECDQSINLFKTNDLQIQKPKKNNDDSNLDMLKCKECLEVFADHYTYANHVIKEHAPSIANQNKKYNCHFCEKSFKQKSAFETHCLKHDKITNQGEETSLNDHYLQQSTKSGTHLTSQSDNKIFKKKIKTNVTGSEKSAICQFCSKSFSKKTNLDRHIKLNHDGVKPFQCEECHKYFQYQYILEQHRQSVHRKERPFPCSSCSKSFSSRATLDIHNRTVHFSNKPFSCSSCQKSFPLKSLLNRHIRMVHYKERAYGCSYCVLRFANKSNLLIHITRKHPGMNLKLEPVVNKDIGDSNNGSTDLLTQTEIIHPESNVEFKPPHQCQYCPKQFYRKQELIRHERTHTGVRPYTCEICNKSFALKATLEGHQRVHTGAKPFQCQDCGQLFSQRSNLRVHIKVHRGTKEHHCKVCSKSFTTSTQLTEHTRIHTGERPFQCTICNKAFTRGKDLTNHKRTHTGDKPYSCSFCGRCFSDRGNMLVHARSHVGLSKPHKCLRCGHAFARRKALTEHEKSHFYVPVLQALV